MEKYESIEHVLESMSSNTVYKIKSPLFQPILFVICGLGCFAAIPLIGGWQPNSVYPPLFMILGLSAFIFGLIKCFYRKYHYVFVENREKINGYEIYFHVSERDKLLRLVENGNLSEIKKLKMSVSSGLRLRFRSTKDGQICLSQVISYESGYVNLSAPRQHAPEEARLLMSMDCHKY